MKKKPGPKPMKASEKRSEMFRIRVTKAEYRQLMKAGGSDWARDLLLKAAEAI